MHIRLRSVSALGPNSCGSPIYLQLIFINLGSFCCTDLIHSGLIKIWYITSKPKLAEPEVEVKLYSNYYNNTLH